MYSIISLCKFFLTSSTENTNQQKTGLEDNKNVPQRSYAEVCDTLIDIGDGSYGYGTFNSYVDNEKDILPYLESEDVIFYRFHDGKGGNPPTVYVGLDVASDLGTKKPVALLSVDGGCITLELKPGDKVVDRKEKELFAVPHLTP